MHNDRETTCDDTTPPNAAGPERRRGGVRPPDNPHLIAIARDPAGIGARHQQRPNSLAPITLVAIGTWSALGAMYLHLQHLW